jgi:hypothetical protein
MTSVQCSTGPAVVQPAAVEPDTQRASLPQVFQPDKPEARPPSVLNSHEVDAIGYPRAITPVVAQSTSSSTTMGAEVTSSTLTSQDALSRANCRVLTCFMLSFFTLLFSSLLLGLSWAVYFTAVPFGLLSLVTSIFALYHLSSQRAMSSGYCCTPLVGYSWIFGMNVVLLVFAVPTLGVCIGIALGLDGSTSMTYAVDRHLIATLGIAAAVATVVLTICAIVTTILLSGLHELCTENLQGFLSTLPVAPPSVLTSHEADARANFKRVPCFLLHVCTLIFSLVLLGFSWKVFFATIPLGFVALVTSSLGVYHFSSLGDLSNECCCVPQSAYSWIFAMNVVLLVFAVPTLVGGAVLIPLTLIFNESGSYVEPAFIIALLSCFVVTFAIVICSIVGMILLSGLRRIYNENLRSRSNFRVLVR